jgi:ubiquitin carboxyl-terminal hydrolase 7
MKNLRESFRDYVKVETLEGDKKYEGEGFGLQDAKKGVTFQSFPPVLNLQLKRFEYDIKKDAMIKVRPEVYS